MILPSIRHLEKVRLELIKTHKLQLNAVDNQINDIRKTCPHTNSYSSGWEGGRFTNCLDYGMDW